MDEFGCCTALGYWQHTSLWAPAANTPCSLPGRTRQGLLLITPTRRQQASRVQAPGRYIRSPRSGPRLCGPRLVVLGEAGGHLRVRLAFPHQIPNIFSSDTSAANVLGLVGVTALWQPRSRPKSGEAGDSVEPCATRESGVLVIGLTATFGVMHDAASQMSENSCRCATLRQRWLRAGRASDMITKLLKLLQRGGPSKQAIPGHTFTLLSRVPAIVADDEGQPTWHRPGQSPYRRVERRSSCAWQRIYCLPSLSTSPT